MLPIVPKVKLVAVGEGIRLCTILATALKPYGFYVALTGGLLYQVGERKDIDIILYNDRSKDEEYLEMVGTLRSVIESCGVTIDDTFGFVTKAKWEGYIVDFLIPESEQKDIYGN